MDFITHCNRALGHQRHEELVAYHKDINEQPKVASLWPMETQIVKIYTKTIFLSFQQELFQSFKMMKTTFILCKWSTKAFHRGIGLSLLISVQILYHVVVCILILKDFHVGICWHIFMSNKLFIHRLIAF